ncbi:MAG: hypothetical protein HFF00_06680 [Ruminiclostridium sp.]|nr:hypothetical protein [Ruminiclostridium sp.]
MNYFMKHSQKAAAVFLAFVMCLSLLPTAAFATGDSKDTVSAPAKLDTAVLYEQLREDEEESVSVTAAQLFDLPNAGLEEQDGEEHYPAQLILNEGQEDERILTPEDLEDLAEAEQPTFRISENEIVLLSPDGGEEQIVTLSAAFDGWDEALPAQVQTFLDAVAEIPEEITADNAEEIAEYVYGPVSEAYEALLGTEYAEREDVKAAEAIYSQAVADVDAALDMENSSYATEHPAQDIAVRPNLTLSDVTYGNNVKNGKLDTYAGKVTKYVGDNGYYLRCPSYQPLCNVSFKNSWGQIVYTCRYSYGLWAAKDYIDINVTSTVPGLIDDIKYSIGTNPYSQLYGSECLRLDYTAIKPGQTEVQQSYYVNFEVKKVSGSYCPNSFKYTPAGQMLPQHTSDFSEGYYWWKYKDAFDVTVKARYQLNYDSQGGSPVNLTYNDVAATTATLKVTNATPTREGYTFKGWAETANAKTAQYTGGEPISLTWSEGYGSTSNPVSKTLHAVWEKTDTKTYTVIYTDGTDGVVFGNESHGKLKNGDKTPDFSGNTEREGYTFMGWAPTVKDTIDPDMADKNGNITYTATWEKNTPQTALYTVQWLDTANTLLKSESRNGTVGTTVSVASSDKSYEGYTYAGNDYNGSVLSATLAKSGTILKMYFIKNTTPPVNPKLEKLEKERLTAEPADVTLNLDGVTVNYNKNVVFVGNDAPAVTLLYKITVTGTAGAQYKVTDADATHVGGDPLIGAIAEGKTQAVIYVTKTFTKDNVVNGQLTNNATLESNGTSENPTDGPEGDNGKGGSSSDAKKQYNVTINFKTDGGTELQKPSKTTVDEGDDFAYTRESTSFMAPVRNAVTNAIVIPERLGENGKYVLDEVASAEGLAKLAAAKNITADVVADIIYSLDTKGTIGTDDAGNPTDTSDGIPDKYQAKVTFKVENGTWNNEETADVVVYVEKYAADGETYAADGTATLADAEIPSAGEKPNANFKAGSWDDTPTKETQVSGDTVYTYTYTAIGSYTVTFDSKGGSAVTSQNVPEGGKVTKPADPTREGYTFNGWNLGDQAYDFSTPVTGDITLTAQWTANQVPPTPKKVTVSWLPGYGDNQPIKTETIDQGTDYAGLYPANPSRSGYTFTGWSDPVTGSDGNITITAQWRQNSGGGGGGSSRPTPRPDPNPGTQIEDPDVPLAGAPGLNTTDHYAYVTGYPDGTVRPQANITRAEVATIFFRLMTDEYRAANWSSTNGFPDVADASLWYNNAVSTAAKAGLLKGKEDGKFYPTANITRAEFATIAARFTSDEEVTAKPFPDTVGHWAEQDIIRAVQAGWIKGNSDGTFRPNDPITRAEAMTLVNRMLDRVPDKDHMLSDMVTWPDNPVSAWFYEAVQEATNSHDYERDEMGVTETWTGKLPDRDWSALEKEWSNAASSVGNDVAGDWEKK